MIKKKRGVRCWGGGGGGGGGEPGMCLVQKMQQSGKAEIV